MKYWKALRSALVTGVVVFGLSGYVLPPLLALTTFSGLEEYDSAVSLASAIIVVFVWQAFRSELSSPSRRLWGVVLVGWAIYVLAFWTGVLRPD